MWSTGERNGKPLQYSCLEKPMNSMKRQSDRVLNVAVSAWDLSQKIAIIFITSTIVWPQVNNKERMQPHPSTENWIKDLLSMAPSVRTRPSFPSVSPIRKLP